MTDDGELPRGPRPVAGTAPSHRRDRPQIASREGREHRGIDAINVPWPAPAGCRSVTLPGGRPRDVGRRTRERRHCRRLVAGEGRQRRGQWNGDDPGLHDGIWVARSQARQVAGRHLPARHPLEGNMRLRRVSARQVPGDPNDERRRGCPDLGSDGRPGEAAQGRDGGHGKDRHPGREQDDRRHQVRRLHAHLCADRHRSPVTLARPGFAPERPHERTVWRPAPGQLGRRHAGRR